VHIDVWSENLKGRYHSGDKDIDTNIILKWIFNRVRGCGLDSSLLGSSDQSNKTLSSIKGRELID
jgi:hypothetical protein